MRDYQKHPMFYMVSQIIDGYTVEKQPAADIDEAAAEFEAQEEMRWLEKGLTPSAYCELVRLARQVFIHKYGCKDNCPFQPVN